MSDPRDRLVFANDNIYGTGNFWLDSFLDCPDDLLAVLVEAGVIERAGYSCNVCGPSKKSEGWYCALGCGRDYNRMTPVYRRIEGGER